MAYVNGQVGREGEVAVLRLGNGEVVKSLMWSPRVGRGRPEGNQAGLPVTRGLQTKGRLARPHWNYPGAGRTFLEVGQVETERVTTGDIDDQLMVQLRFEEVLSRPGRRERGLADAEATASQRRGCQRYLASMCLQIDG